MRLKLLVTTATAALAASLPGVAFAQQGAPAPETAQESDDTIIVTAQRRAQNLQDVSNAVTALSSDRIERSGVQNVLDLGTVAPNVTIGDSFGQADIAIRGQGRTGPITGSDPAVAFHVDGAVVSKVQAQLASFFDLERIEVLRGPQGTLYGRNSTGGAVNLITRRPTEHNEAYVRVTYGNYDLIETTGAVSGPIANNLLGRLSWRTQNRSGFGVNEVSGDDIDDANQRSIRGQLQLNATPDLTVRLSGEWHMEDDAAYGFKYYGAGYPGTTDPNLMALGIGGYATGGPRNIRSEAAIRNDRETWAVTGTVDWRLNDRWTFQSLTNYREIVNNPIVDFDSSAVVNPVISNNYLDSNQFSQEFQFQYDAPGLNGLVGLFYFREDTFADNRSGFNPAIDAAPDMQSLANTFRGTQETESFAAFANVSFDLNEQFSLVLAGRYTHETKDTDAAIIIFPNTVRPAVLQGKYENFAPRVTLEYRPVEDLMLYAAYAKGFRAGVTLIGPPDPPTRPEIVDSYELGVRAAFLDRTLFVNLTGFYADYKDLQVSKSAPAFDAVRVTSIFENAAAAVGKGVEAEIVWRPSRAFRFQGAAGYLDATFQDYVSSNPSDLPNAAEIDLEGYRLPRSPEWNLSGRAEYNLFLAHGGELSFGAEVDHRTRVYFTQFMERRLSQGPVTIVNADIRYTSPNGQFTVDLWARNLGDTLMLSFLQPNSTARTINATYMAPRTYGVTLGYQF